MKNTRRQFLEVLGAVSAVAVRSGVADDAAPAFASAVEPSFLVRREELELNYRPPVGARRLSFAEHRADPQRWRESCRRKLGELCAISSPAPSEVKELRSCSAKGVTFRALVMPVASGLSVAAYVLEPEGKRPRGAVMAIQGHGDVEGVMGVIDDYHHGFGFELARTGFLVLCPVLRGFGVLRNLAWASRGERCLDYWSWDRGPQFTLVTDGFVRGRTLLGETVGDLLRWEQWLGETRRIERLDVAGISYGGDVAILYPVFSRRVRRIFASGTLGSFEPVFSRCYNAPAHCIPGILEWMDRSDIAGLNAPRPIALHYGELNRPGSKNNSASNNETVEPALRELREIYRAFGAEAAVQHLVSAGHGHEMDLELLEKFLSASDDPTRSG